MKRQLFSFLILLLFVLSVSAQTDEARKVDEFGNLNCDDYSARMDDLWIKLNNLPDAKGYVFIYEGKIENAVYDKNGKYKGEQYFYPKIGEAKTRIRYMQQLIRFGKFSPGKFVFIEAGFREKFTIEYWIVPNEATLPVPTSILEKMKHRKGKRENICGEF